MKYKRLLSGSIFSVLILFSLILSACNPRVASTPNPTSTAPVTQVFAPNTPELTQTRPTLPVPTQTSTTAPSPTLNPTITPLVNTPTAIPTFTAASAKTTLINAFTQLANAYPFRITETDRGLVGVTHVTTDYAAADRYHTITVQEPNPNMDETITIGEKTWWKIKGTWDPNPSWTLGQNNFWTYKPKAQDVTYTSQDTVDGVSCFVFSFKLDVHSPGIYLTGSGQARVGISDSHPYQFDFSPGVNVTGQPTHQVYTYGITVDIQQPVP